MIAGSHRVQRMREHVTQFKELPQLPFLQCALGKLLQLMQNIYVLHREVDQEVWFLHIWSIFASQIKFSEMLATYIASIYSYIVMSRLHAVVII